MIQDNHKKNTTSAGIVVLKMVSKWVGRWWLQAPFHDRVSLCVIQMPNLSTFLKIRTPVVCCCSCPFQLSDVLSAQSQIPSARICKDHT